MKKSILSFLALAMSGFAFAQTNHVVLYEEFTGENCGPCASTNPYVNATLHFTGNYGPKIVSVKYQVPIPSAPGANSLYGQNSTEANARRTYYNVPFAPYARFNGTELPDPNNAGHAGLITQQYINDSSAVNAIFNINLTHSYTVNDDSVNITATITANQNYNANGLVFQLTLQEKEIHLAAPTGSNGEKDFYDVMRKMIPDANGTSLGSSWTAGQTQVLNWKVKIPTYIYKKSEIVFVGFIQNNNNKYVLQAGISDYKPMNLDIFPISNGAGYLNCATTFAPTFILKNNSMQALTSADITYKIDANPNNNFNWTGNLASGQTQVVTLPNVTTTAGNHTLTITTNNPNNLGADHCTANDQLVSKFYVMTAFATLPVAEGFVATTFPPTNWALNNIDGGYTMSRTTAAGGFGTSSNSVKIPFEQNANDGDLDELILPRVNLSTAATAQLTFDVAYNYFSDPSWGDYFDTIAVYISNDCGNTWSTLYYKGGAQLKTTTTNGQNTSFTPTANQWRTENINLNAYAGQADLLVKFVGINNYGNNGYLDNINLSMVTGISENSNLLFAEVYPNPSNGQFNVKFSLASAQQVSVMVYNNLGALVAEQNAGELGSGDHNLRFDGTIPSGIYNVVVKTETGKLIKRLTITQ